MAEIDKYCTGTSLENREKAERKKGGAASQPSSPGQFGIFSGETESFVPPHIKSGVFFSITDREKKSNGGFCQKCEEKFV